MPKLGRDHRIRILAAYMQKRCGIPRTDAIVMLLEAGPDAQIKMLGEVNYIFKYVKRKP